MVESGERSSKWLPAEGLLLPVIAAVAAAVEGAAAAVVPENGESEWATQMSAGPRRPPSLPYPEASGWEPVGSLERASAAESAPEAPEEPDNSCGLAIVKATVPTVVHLLLPAEFAADGVAVVVLETKECVLLSPRTMAMLPPPPPPLLPSLPRANDGGEGGQPRHQKHPNRHLDDWMTPLKVDAKCWEAKSLAAV